MASVESKNQSNVENDEEFSSKSTPNLVEKELGIQWETLRDFITWQKIGGTTQGPPELPDESRIRSSKLSAIPNASFDELSNCVVKIPRKHIGGELTAFIRSRRELQCQDVLSHWLRMMGMDVIEDICPIIESFYVDKDYDEDTLSVSADWMVGFEKKSSPQQRRLNQSRLFKELQSIADGDDTTDIAGVTLIWAKTINQYSWGRASTTTLHLNANGSYVFEEKGHSSWIESESESAEEYSDEYVLKHCGVWNYKGDEIVVEGFGFRDSESTDYDDELDEDEGDGETNTFSTKLAIQRPVAVQHEAMCREYSYCRRCSGREKDFIAQKCRETKRCKLSVFVYF